MNQIKILPQPNAVTCGPTCLHSVYNYYNDLITLEEVIKSVKQFRSGGTLGVYMGISALRRGYDVDIFTYNLNIYDPTWFDGKTDISAKLTEQMKAKKSPRITKTCQAYIDFVNLGGRIKFEILTPALLKWLLDHDTPVLTGLSATLLYNESREIGALNKPDDVRGEPVGHFVVLSGIDHKTDMVGIADPLNPNPMSKAQHYLVDVDRVINSILLGVVTYDANLLIIKPKYYANVKVSDNGQT